MPGYYYKNTDVSGVISVRSLEDSVESTAEFPKTIDSVSFVETTATPNNDAVISIWVENEMIAEIDINQTIEHVGADERNFRPAFQLNRPLEPGETLKVGQTSGGTASDFNFCVQYHMTGEL